MKKILIATFSLIAALAQADEPELVFYPAVGQTNQQQDKDRSECDAWSRKESGYEWSQPLVTLPNAPPLRAAPTTALASRAPGPTALPQLPSLPPAPPVPLLTGREQQRVTYERARAACMEGRGYIVR
ncbi:hypothetical protein [Rivibacter subsaxonicus]|uniref:hypothetical protein n=1 Tax=Rivibacter subsaxonicus TaxID=457575 RepID=UPI00102BFE7B|nr:hypothetical protein [Rivibacter subsaxonicus]